MTARPNVLRDRAPTRRAIGDCSGTTPEMLHRLRSLRA
jgi:hypothetical protein